MKGTALGGQRMKTTLSAVYKFLGKQYEWKSKGKTVGSAMAAVKGKAKGPN